MGGIRYIPTTRTVWGGMIEQNHRSVGLSSSKSIEISEEIIKNPNSYQKSLFCLFKQGEIDKLEYYLELVRYDDFLIKQTILSNDHFDKLVSNIEMKELITYLMEVDLNK